MGRLQIENRRQQEEKEMDPKKQRSPLALPPLQQVQGNQVKTFLKNGNSSSIIHKIKLQVIHLMG